MALRLIVGLGNPGSKYEQTRHNAGFWFADELARRHKLSFCPDSRSQGLIAHLDWEGVGVYLLKPWQYMNRSGEVVSALVNFYKIRPSEILIAHDELDFAAGVVKLKVGGGHGGHNGLRDVISRLGSSDFVRMRLGIGHPGSKDDVVKYVLERPSRHDDEQLHEAISRAADCLPQLLTGKLEMVMNALHS